MANSFKMFVDSSNVLKKLLPKFDQFSEQGLTTWRSSNQNWSSELKIYNNNINLKEVQFGIIV